MTQKWDKEMTELRDQIAQNLYDGLAEEVGKGTKEALDQGIAPEDILNGALVEA